MSLLPRRNGRGMATEEAASVEKLRPYRTPAIVLIAATIEFVLLLNVFWPLPNEEGESWPWVIGLMAFPLVSALLLVHRPDNRCGWALGVSALSAGLIFLMSWYGYEFPSAPFSREIEALERIPASGQFAGLVALIFIFPTGRTANRFFHRVFQAYLAVVAATTVLFVLSPRPLHVTQRENPLALLPDSMKSVAEDSFFLILVFALVGAVSLAVRWRGANQVERAQLKWFLTGAVFTPIIFMLVNILPSEEEAGIADVIGGLVAASAFWALPTAIVIAILRYRLYDIDRVINRALVYAVLTAGLGALYLGVVVGLQALLSNVAGGSDLAIVITTLLVAALFLPARRRVQDIVDRRFNRRTYDAARTIDAFSARLRQQIDLDTQRYELLTVADETMQPASASVWLRGKATLR